MGTCILTSDGIDLDQGCFVHQICGSLRHPSSFSIAILPVAPNITSDAIINEYHYPFQIMKRVYVNRSAHSMSGHVLGNFIEDFLSGDFTFQVDLTELYFKDPVMAGAIMWITRNLVRLGRGFNSGYGHIQAVKYTLSKKRRINEDTFDEETNTWICLDRFESEILVDETKYLINSFEEFLNSISKLNSQFNLELTQNMENLDNSNNSENNGS